MTRCYERTFVCVEHVEKPNNRNNFKSIVFVSGFTYLGVHRDGFLVLQVISEKDHERDHERIYDPAKFLAEAEEAEREEKRTKRRLEYIEEA